MISTRDRTRMPSPRVALQRLQEYVAGRAPPRGIKLSSNENPLGSSPRALEAARAALIDAQRYPDPAALQLRRAIARRWDLSLEEVIVGNGSDELMVLAAAAFVNDGDSGITARHTFSLYRFAIVLYGGEVIETAMQAGGFVPQHILAAIDERTAIVFICNPNNPTGAYLNTQQLEGLLEQIPSQVLVVLDEAYADFAEAPNFPDSRRLPARFGNLLILRTFSKLYGLAGLRVGYGVGQSQLIGALQRARQPFNVNSVAQAAACAALEDIDFHALTLRTVHSGKRYLYDHFTRMGLRYRLSQANFVCLQTPEGIVAASLAEGLLQRGVAVRMLCSFGLERWLRVSIGTMEHNRAFIDALQQACDDLR